jgi:hypothetical protein
LHISFAGKADRRPNACAFYSLSDFDQMRYKKSPDELIGVIPYTHQADIFFSQATTRINLLGMSWCSFDELAAAAPIKG